MTKSVDFIFDFASPNAYLVHRVLPGIAERTGATFRYIPCLLGGIFKATGNQAPMIAFAPIPNKLAYEQLEFGRFIARHGLSDFTFNPHFPVNTVLLQRGALVAERDGRLMDYVEAGLHHMWEAPKNMSDPETYAEAMSESGFDGAALVEGAQDAAIKQKLIDNTGAAVERGAFGIPTFYVGQEMFFGKERLDQVEEAVATLAD
ncbi:2-hydroxychromene-2-carboxylate isomerase [Parasphingopyxis lamellibrachiae]|uniref:2-hydroxychromene-2-carboxylate isomerase n=1 Tax=Parasphingopyxis lamellibrachiae TaxID=680125 RepID=A0A3D9FJ94_9SPHN|nr:2-hydroxychromene-2-carboxylate isomerase [Parasphingopyxis lamellibrachiae]RED17171.1 2-hydroxychromene-2-carboxylate isomerase [Parasphingopyxis lamellibrachiae]